MNLRTCLITTAVSAAVATMASADVTGTIKLDGKAPEPKQIDMSGVKECHALHADPVYDETVFVGENGELANVVVFVKTDDPDSLGGDVPKEPAVIDQQGCMYVPHVLAMMVGQDLIVKNDDPFLHNVHSLAQQNPSFNFGQPNKDPGRKVDSPKVRENIKVKCDVHPWMGMYIIVLEHPFFAVSGEDGTFTIKGELPDGDYTLTAWHEKYGTQDVQVTVSGGKGELAEPITFKGGSASAEPVNSDVRLASLRGEKANDCGTPCCDTVGATLRADASAAVQPAAQR